MLLALFSSQKIHTLPYQATESNKTTQTHTTVTTGSTLHEHSM